MYIHLNHKTLNDIMSNFWDNKIQMYLIYEAT